MSGRISSWFLILLLTFSVAAKELTVGFCLCERTLFLSELPCESPHNGTHCCGADERAASEEDLPREDCVVRIQLEIADYTWSTDTTATPAPASTVVATPQPTTALRPQYQSLSSGNTLRAPPPSSTPLFLRNLVFRI